ncbi:MAG: HypC/HybG/HupF family hydrogenase formation chaperone [Bacteroidota bacterium]
MCLSIPSKVLSVSGNKAIVSVGGTQYEASIQLLDDVKVDDYVLLHTGFAIQIISEKDAIETLELIRELGEIDQKIRDDEEIGI